jgi:hypothetical protein
MSFFKKSWKKLHKKAVQAYEDIAIPLFIDAGGDKPVDFKWVIQRVVKRLNPAMSAQEAARFVESNYALFKTFNVYDEIASECRARNPQIPDEGIKELYEALKRVYVEQMEEHNAFLTFIISRFIEPSAYNISRGAYFMEVAQGKAPKSGGVLRRASQIAMYKRARGVKEQH